MKLTTEELETLINIVAQVNVPVNQAQSFIDLANKLSKMVGEIKPVNATQEK